eukprot:m.25622 g.25622  ORF g.25622 m.25622 type:complete len:369 (-) comp4460_c0_seq1:173-1279(-)
MGGKAAVCLLAVVFMGSGLLVNMVQLASLLLWPVSRRAYRIFNSTIVCLYWNELIWLAEWWANIRIRIFVPTEQAEVIASNLGRERAAVLCNHGSDVDWLLGWLVAAHYNCLGGTKCLLKKELRYIPVLGWSWWFLEYIFLQRNWEHDRIHLRKSFQRLVDFPLAFWMVIFAEGTRFSKEKQQASAEHSKLKNLPVLKHVLYPRTKGWNLVIDELADHLDAVYSTTFAFPDHPLTLHDLMERNPCEVQVFIERKPVSEVPRDEAGCGQFCVDRFVEMDARLEQFSQTKMLEGTELPQQRSTTPAFTMGFWVLLASVVFALVVVPFLLANVWMALICLVGIPALGMGLIQMLLFQGKKSNAPRETAKTK